MSAAMKTGRSNGIPRAHRDQAMRAEQIETTPPSPQKARRLTTQRGRQILAALLTQVRPDGSTGMLNRAELETSANMMQQLYYNGWVNGAGSRDDRGSGNTPESSWWWLTTTGELYARALASPVK